MVIVMNNGVASADVTSFERGWSSALALWKSGLTLGLITRRADKRAAESAFEFSRGMVAAVEALGGWLDVARREAKAHAIPESTVERLIDLARNAQ